MIVCDAGRRDVAGRTLILLCCSSPVWTVNNAAHLSDLLIYCFASSLSLSSVLMFSTILYVISYILFVFFLVLHDIYLDMGSMTGLFKGFQSALCFWMSDTWHAVLGYFKLDIPFAVVTATTVVMLGNAFKLQCTSGSWLILGLYRCCHCIIACFHILGISTKWI